TIVCTAQDGATTRTYVITATRAAAGMAAEYVDNPAIAQTNSEVAVRQGLSPNGDGDNDVLIINGIINYPDNTLQIMNRSGQLVYRVKGYDNRSKVFDGQSNINGKLQPAGTYFYSLDYKDGNETRHKTGFIVLRY
ncbi:MAG: gliding motility-associated C-terminal domain-containing protein, partial [Bacteroidota bacterium]